MFDVQLSIEFVRNLRSLTDEVIVWLISLIGGYHAIRYSLRFKKR